MKCVQKPLVKGMIFISLFFIVVNCSKKDKEDPVEKGSLKLNVGISVLVANEGSKLKSATSTGEYRVQIFNSDNTLVKEYANASEVPATIELAAGNYYAVAFSENSQAAAFANPYYYGNSGAFTIKKDETSTANITCKLANIMVTVVYSSQVKNSFTNYSTKVSNSSANLVFSKDEARAGYFDAGPLQIEATLTYTAGSETKTKTLTGSIQNPTPGKHYEINIDAAQNAGNSVINISLDEAFETEVINIGGSSNPPTPGELKYGDLLISEIMYHPFGLEDAQGEWIEIYNNTSGTVNLKDLVLIRSSNSTFHKIASDVNVSSGGYAVLACSITATNNVSYVYGSKINLVNTGYELILATYGTTGLNGTKICSVDYRGEGFPGDKQGKSIQLDKTIKNATAATIGSNWCSSSVEYSTGDYGTPGEINSDCN